MMAKALRLTFVATLLGLLAACAEQPSKPQPSPSVAIAAPGAPAPVVAPLQTAAPAPADLWTRLRAQLALDDCSDARAQSWAKRFTQSPERFAAQLQKALPLLAYVLDVAERTGVPGEFVLLPMVESGYNPAESGRHGDPAGMWQIMPQTAHTLGLAVNREYDGRLDPVVSTQAVLAMLKEYKGDLHDWRLVDMAFNAGEYRITGLVGDRDIDSLNVPHLPVGSVTHNHLAKLMALACIVRDPQRFDVDLPSQGVIPLTLVQLPQAVGLAPAARAADISLAQLRALNPGYRGNRMPEDAPHHLLLPQDNAQRLTAMLDTEGAAALAAAETPNTPSQIADVESSSSTQSKLAAAHRGAARHRVARGESLQSIARRYKVDPLKLRAWNALASDQLHPGQVLRLGASN